LGVIVMDRIGPLSGYDPSDDATRKALGDSDGDGVVQESSASSRQPMSSS